MSEERRTVRVANAALLLTGITFFFVFLIQWSSTGFSLLPLNCIHGCEFSDLFVSSTLLGILVSVIVTLLAIVQLASIRDW